MRSRIALGVVGTHMDGLLGVFRKGIGSNCAEQARRAAAREQRQANPAPNRDDSVGQ